MKYLASIALFILISGCNPDGVGCFKSTGPYETQLRDLPYFKAININNNIDVNLSSDQSNEVSVSAGSNLLPGIRTEVIDSVLFIENLNTCNFTRKYVNPLVTIANPGLEAITQHGFGNIKSLDTLRYDYLKLVSEDGSGDFTLAVNTKSLSIGTNNLSKMKISGYTDQLSVGVYWSDAVIQCEDLSVATICYLNHSGSNSIHLNVTGSLIGSINSLGNVYLHEQVPIMVDVSETSEGRLIYDF